MDADLARVQRFIRTTLGCQCPDSVLQWIECSQSTSAEAQDLRLTRIDVGGRLLVYVVEADRDPPAAAAAVPAVLASALIERDTGGFNRLRLVVASREPDEIRDRVEAGFATSMPRDDRVHLHVVAADELPFD